MGVIRIVPNIAAGEIEAGKIFYADVLGMTVAMDHGWIVTFVGSGDAHPQVSIATQGGSGMPVPDISIEVDDLPAVLRRAIDAGYKPEYGPVAEPWGVTRFFVRDPYGRLLNILCHAEKD